MTRTPETRSPELLPKPAALVDVWDLPLRLFHWTLVIVVVIGGVTGFLAPDWWLDVHVIAGYGLAWLLVFRLAWGVLGSRFSRFDTFPLAPRLVVEYARRFAADMVAGRKRPGPLGHNPLGAWMIVVLLATLFVLTFSGLIALGGQEKLGPLAFAFDYHTGHGAKEVHEMAAWVLLALIAIHLIGVFVDERLAGHPILAAMLSGRKPVLDAAAVAPRRGVTRRGAWVVALVGAVGMATAGGLASLPAHGWRPLDLPTVFSAECGDCHVAHHPSLRSRQSWRAIVAGLAAHYGEDASLDPGAEKQISDFLAANASETFDTEAAWRIGRSDTATQRITDTRYWKKRHAGIDLAVFKQRAVGSKINCNACHRDAPSGLFADQAIHLPDGDEK